MRHARKGLFVRCLVSGLLFTTSLAVSAEEVVLTSPRSQRLPVELHPVD